MYRYKKILPGNYRRRDVNGSSYIIGNEKDIKSQFMEFSDDHKSQMIEDFISIDADSSEEILCFTNKYGPIMCMGYGFFKEAAKVQGKKLPSNVDKSYPIQKDYSFPEYQFKYFHELVINIWELQNDIAQGRHDKKLVWDFFRLLFQPYGWCEYDKKHLSGKSKMPMAMFAQFYHEIAKEISAGIEENGVEWFLWIVYANEVDGIQAIHKFNDRRYRKVEVSEQYKKELYEQDDFWVLIYILEEIRGKGVFESLERSFEEFEAKVDLKDLNDEIFQIIRHSGGTLICEIVNDYITSLNLFINEKGNFVMNSGDNFLISIIFDELAVLCQHYEARKCKFRKCHKYYIANKETKRQKNYCCKDCADKEIKYRKREGRI